MILGIIVLVVIVAGVVLYARNSGEDKCCEVRPSSFPVNKEAVVVTPAPKKTRKSTRKTK